MRHDSDNFESLELLGETEYGEIRESSPSFQRIRKPITSTSLIAAGVFLFFFLDVVAFLYIGKLLLDAKHSIANLDRLEFRDPYVGLDELYGEHRINSSIYDAVVNEPRLSAQISPKQADEVFPVDSHRWLSDFGLLSPPDRRFKVSNKLEIFTVTQFHILDYGMENCSLKIRLPRREDVLPHPFSLPSKWDSVPLDICELDVRRPLKEWAVSWTMRPKCIRPLGTFNAKIGQESFIDNFSCKSGSFVGYQISCAQNSPQCDIDVWSNQNATWGIYIEQHQTVL